MLANPQQYGHEPMGGSAAAPSALTSQSGPQASIPWKVPPLLDEKFWPEVKGDHSHERDVQRKRRAMTPEMSPMDQATTPPTGPSPEDDCPSRDDSHTPVLPLDRPQAPAAAPVAAPSSAPLAAAASGGGGGVEVMMLQQLFNNAAGAVNNAGGMGGAVNNAAGIGSGGGMGVGGMGGGGMGGGGMGGGSMLGGGMLGGGMGNNTMVGGGIVGASMDAMGGGLSNPMNGMAGGGMAGGGMAGGGMAGGGAAGGGMAGIGSMGNMSGSGSGGGGAVGGGAGGSGGGGGGSLTEKLALQMALQNSAVRVPALISGRAHVCNAPKHSRPCGARRPTGVG